MGGIQAVLGQCSGTSSASVSIAFGHTSWPHASRRDIVVFATGFNGLISHSHDKYFGSGFAPETCECVQEEHDPNSRAAGLRHWQGFEELGVGVLKVNNGAVSISVGMVLVVCQFGHIVVPHTIVGSTTCPRVVPTQLQDHESAVVPLGTFGMTRAHLPYAVLVGGGQVVDEDVLLFVVELVEPVGSLDEYSAIIFGMGGTY